MKIIAFGHRAGVGKDTAAQCLIDRGWVTLSFAQALKDVTAALFNVPREHFDSTILKETKLPIWGCSPRDLLIWFGTAIIRDKMPEHWCNLVYQKIIERYTDSIVIDDKYHFAKTCTVPGIVITDLRFPNELQLCKQIGALTVKVTRADAPVLDNIADNALEGKEFDITLSNDGDKGELWASVLDMASESAVDHNTIPYINISMEGILL